MPNQSERASVIRQLESLFEYMIIFDEDETSDFDDLMTLLGFVESSRYINLRNYETNKRSLNDLLWEYSDKNFRQIVRMEKSSFQRLLTIISGHPVFNRATRNRYTHYVAKQAPVWIQLMVVLIRLGCHGNGVSVGHVGRLCGYSLGSVVNFTNRVFTAILSLEKEFVRWPNAHERKKISKRFQRRYGIPGVGIIDGTHVIFAQKPHIDGETYWCRKQFYSSNVILICNDKGSIIFYVIGWPGSLYDYTIFDKTKLVRFPERYFSPGEFVLADAGFALKWYCITPYRHPAAELPENKIFNHYFSSARVTIEHVNGWLKNRFSSLRGIRTQIRIKSDFELVNKHVLVCLILHNILLKFKDEQFDEPDDDFDVIDGDVDDVEDIDAAAYEEEMLRYKNEPQELKAYVHEELYLWINTQLDDI